MNRGMVTNNRECVCVGGGGGATKTGGGTCEVLPLRKAGGRKSFSHAEGGAQKVLG